MAPFERFGGDAVALGAAGILLGTALAALHAPLLLAFLCAALPLASRMRLRVVLGAALLVTFLLAPLRGIGSRAEIIDPLEDARDAALLPLVSSVPSDAGALAAGLTLGEDRYFSPGFRDAMRATSTTHLVALSGFNVTLLLGFARRLLRKRVCRRKEALAGILLLAGFVTIAGLQPSLVRAALMGAAVLAGSLAGKRLAPARLLLLTAAAMLLFEPRFSTHLGFQLSFIASWALAVMFGDVERLISSGMSLRELARRAFLPTFVAQIGVAPALLAAVGSVSLAGLLINPAVIPLTPLLTALSGAELLLAHLAPGLAFFLSPILTLAMLPVTAGILLAARVPLVVPFALPVTFVVFLYAGSVAWSLRYRPRLW